MDTTIVIPTYERAGILLETLGALAKVDYPRSHWEAIVVDDGSRPETLAVIKDWIAVSDAPLRLVQEQHRGPAAARNRGAREAAGQVLIFLDNDCLVASDFIRRHLQVLEEHPGCWIIGRVVHPPKLRTKPFGRYRDNLYEAFHRSHGATCVSKTDGISAQNLAVWTVDFARLGGFDEDFAIASCEDWELGQRARDAGIPILYDPHNVVTHNDWAVSLDLFCDRQRLYSVSDVLLWRKYGERSPRARLVRANGPVRWREDSVDQILKKIVKGLLATRVGNAMLQAMCAMAERIRPDSSWSHRVYDLAVAVAIFSGVREGFRRFG